MNHHQRVQRERLIWQAKRLHKHMNKATRTAVPQGTPSGGLFAFTPLLALAILPQRRRDKLLKTLLRHWLTQSLR